jgi:hypothetical protein
MHNKIIKLLMALFCVGVILTLTVPAASAQVWDKKTTITVNQPFEVPGRVLPAGTYVMRIVDAAGFRRVVRFFSPDEKKVYATVIGIPDFKLDAPEKTDITFYESAVGAPRPLHAWFYPDSQFGVEFAYAKKRAVEIAAAAGEHVPALDLPAVAALEPLPGPAIKELLEEPIIAIEPGGQEVELSEVHPAPSEPALQAELTTPALPKTATPIPFVALIGLLAGGAASVLRLWKR